METYSQYIELINDYLNNLLSKDAQINFESRLQNDLEFKAIYEEHLVFVNGLKRISIKSDIQKARRAYFTEKWLKISGISIIALGVLVLLYTLIFNTSEVEPPSNNDSINTIIVDSTSIEKSSIETTIDSATIESNIASKTVVSEEKLIAKADYDPLKKQHQTLRINVQKDTIIRCKEGTILNIKKEAFINPKTEKPVTGIVNLKVTEYYKLSDILMANLSTVSNGKQLETGGMLYIEAKQGHTKLELNRDIPMEISFPNRKSKPGMQLFSGEWKNQNINWELENLDELVVVDIPTSEETMEEDIEVPFSVVEVVPTFPGCENDDNELRKKCTTAAISKFISRNFNVNIGIDVGLTGRQRINSIFKIDQKGNIIYVQSRASHPRLSEEADRVLNMLPQMIPGKQRGRTVIVPYSLPIVFEVQGGLSRNSNRDSTSSSTQAILLNDIPISNPIELDTIYTERRGMIEHIREVMHDNNFPVDSLFMLEWEQYKKQRLIREIDGLNNKRYILRKSLFEMTDTKFKILEDDSITRGGHVIRVPWDRTKITTITRVMNVIPKRKFSAGTEYVSGEEFEARLGDEADTSISTRDASYYVMRTSKLGWINCDRFINGRTKRIKYKLKIKNADGAVVNMVFKSYNSILPSWYTQGAYDFKTVGTNEDIVLVAIKRKNGKLYFDAVETKTEVNPSINFEFKEATIDELKAELEKLNSTFD